jgi:hypothetical protein
VNAERQLREVLERQRQHLMLPEEVVPDMTAEERAMYE